MDEMYLLKEMAKCKDEIRYLRAEIGILEDKFDYLKELYYQSGTAYDGISENLGSINEKIRTDGFIIGIRF